ncbi:MAG: N-acetyltransferase family protein [Cyanobacteria bacterium P01_C01_bin.72]
MTIKIRPYQSLDCQEIADIYNEAVESGGITMDCEPYSAAKIRAITEKFNSREMLLVGEKDGIIVGWGIIKRYSDRTGYRLCCETSIYLKFSETGKGYGRTLQTALLEKVKEFNYHHVVAKILAANQGSIKFHQQFGFELVGVQQEIGFARGQWLDVALMQLLLS